jgi:hypothetical protein
MDGRETLSQHGVDYRRSGSGIHWIGGNAVKIPAGQMSQTDMRPKYPGDIVVIKPAGCDWNSKERIILSESFKDRRRLNLLDDC